MLMLVLVLVLVLAFLLVLVSVFVLVLVVLDDSALLLSLLVADIAVAVDCWIISLLQSLST